MKEFSASKRASVSVYALQTVQESFFSNEKVDAATFTSFFTHLNFLFCVIELNMSKLHPFALFQVDVTWLSWWMRHQASETIERSGLL